jgi:hypothetical protein
VKKLLLPVLFACSAAWADSVEDAWYSLVGEKFAERPQFAWVEDDPDLPNVLLYGDSISIGYTQDVREQLAGQADVYRIHRNGGDSARFILAMEAMHVAMRNESLDEPWRFEWDVIHLNVGLHDLKFVKDGELDKKNGTRVTTPAQYEQNLREIFDYLAMLVPDADIIFATTTPVPDGARGRHSGDADKYNDVARRVVADYPRVVLNDLYALTSPNQESWWSKPGNVHFNDVGKAAQGEAVARSIRNALTDQAQRQVYVAPDGDDDNPGTLAQPLKSLRVAAERVGESGRILLRGGRYLEPLEVRKLRGRPGAPAVIQAVPGEQALLDGTDAMEGEWREVTRDSAAGRTIQPVQWERIGNQTVYALQIDEPVHALVYEDRLMSEARWPDARWDDPWRLDRYNVLRRATEESTPGRLVDGFPTDNTLEESSKWVHYDREARAAHRESLAETGLDFSDAVVVMSYAWGSWATRITEHAAGSNALEFDTSFKGSGSIREEAVAFVINRIQWDNPARFRRSSHGGIHFFIEGLPALDTAEEWWYDADTQVLYFIPPDGQRPASGAVRGKRRDFMLGVFDASHVIVKGLDFHGSAMRVEDSVNSRIEDCNFRFSSSNKFTVGNFDMPVTTRIANKNEGDRLFGNALVNCSFSYLDGNAFEGRSTGRVIDNVRIFRTQQTTLGLDSRSMSIDRPAVVRRVSIDDVGASVGIKGGGIDSVYELNNISRFGGLQFDGAALQMGGQQRFLYRYNWSHDHPKRSYRFDAGSYPSFSNAHGEMSYNVAWNTPGGFAIKGDDHLIHNNLQLGDSKFELFNMERWAGKNERTVVANNAVSRLSAGTNDRDPDKKGQPAEVMSVQFNNRLGDPSSELRDPANLDFRPRAGGSLVDAGYVLKPSDVPWKNVPFTGTGTVHGEAPDIGPYEFGATSYWIPGFRSPVASTPVPVDGTSTAKPDADLMWLGGYQASMHLVYFGTSRDAVAAAAVGDPEYRGQFIGAQNIFEPGPLERGRTYYWRVDAGSVGQLHRGRVWSFTVGE